MQIYDLQGNLVENDGSSGGGDGSSGGSGRETWEDDYELDPRTRIICFNLPYISESAEVDSNKKLKFDDGTNWVTSNAEATSQTEFVQSTSIEIDGERYFFTTKYSFDGYGMSSSISFEDGEKV